MSSRYNNCLLLTESQRGSLNTYSSHSMILQSRHFLLVALQMLDCRSTVCPFPVVSLILTCSVLSHVGEDSLMATADARIRLSEKRASSNYPSHYLSIVVLKMYTVYPFGFLLFYLFIFCFMLLQLRAVMYI